MDAINGTVTIWLIAQGLFIGMIFGIVINKEGVSVPANMMGGIIGSVTTGYIAIIFGFGDGLLFALMGTLAILFLLNAFHFHHVEDILGHVSRGIQIHRKREN